MKAGADPATAVAASINASSSRSTVSATGSNRACATARAAGSAAQTAATGFAEGQAEFTPAPKAPKAPDPATIAKAQAVAEGVADQSLRSALEQLAQNILTRPRS